MKIRLARKFIAMFFTLCVALSFVPIAASAESVTDELKTGSNYTHTYHTKIDTTAKVTIKDAYGNEIETTSVNKVGSDFIEGSLDSDAVKAEIERIYKEIESQFASKGSVTMENCHGQMAFHHFEGSNIVSGDDSSGNVNKHLDVHEYQVYKIDYDITVQTNSKLIDLVEINDVTLNFKDGDKPVFTGKVPDGADYAYRCEWWELDRKTGAMSTDFGNFYENKFTNFEAGKTYHYGVYVTTIYGDRYVFGPDTKLKINGEFVNYKRYEGDTSDGPDDTMWVITDLTMTPQATGEATEYKVIEGANSSWIQNSDETLTFRINGDLSKFVGIKVDDEWVDKENYTTASGSTVVTLKNEYLKTLSVGEHKITFVYTDSEASTNFEVKESGKIYEKSSIPKTGDTSNILVWYSLFASALIVFGIIVYNKKKKSII